ncbi:LysR family transcriptional regulator, partial [Pseudomonas aeruginosa]|nr:LysR family transcriptional regulator [Pseudomonas aeruginosa]
MIRELRTLVAVARRGSFAAAGEQVGLTQSAVSAQIRALERSVGVELFKRTPRAAHLNKAGRQAVRTAEQILALFDGIGQGDSPRGRLRIGAVNTAQTGLLPEVLKRLAEQAPHIEPQVVPGVSLHLLDQVDAAELDLAILIRPPFNLPRGL